MWWVVATRSRAHEQRGLLQQLRALAVGVSSAKTHTQQRTTDAPAPEPRISLSRREQGPSGPCIRSRQEWGFSPVGREMKQKYRLQLVNKNLARVEVRELREATTGRVVLTRVWAVADHDSDRMRACEALRQDGAVNPEVGAHRAKSVAVVGDVVFYRKYTVGILRRYLWLSMAGGRVASLLGRELFHGNVTNYSVHNYEEVAIFCIDVEKCLKRLTSMERALLKRIAVQQYSQGDAALEFGISLRSCIQRYHGALDRLTSIFLEARMLEPLKSCQEGLEVSLYICK